MSCYPKAEEEEALVPVEINECCMYIFFLKIEIKIVEVLNIWSQITV